MCDFLVVIFLSCHYHFSYAGSIIRGQQPSRGIAKALVKKCPRPFRYNRTELLPSSTQTQVTPTLLVLTQLLCAGASVKLACLDVQNCAFHSLLWFWFVILHLCSGGLKGLQWNGCLWL